MMRKDEHAIECDWAHISVSEDKRRTSKVKCFVYDKSGCKLGSLINFYIDFNFKCFAPNEIHRPK